jgi:hypothetical protein
MTNPDKLFGAPVGPAPAPVFDPSVPGVYTPPPGSGVINVAPFVPNTLPDPLTALENAVLQAPSVQNFFEHFPFQDQTLALAGDVNAMQNRIEDGLRRLDAGVEFSLNQLLYALTAFANLSIRRQKLFEQNVTEKIAENFAIVQQELVDIRTYINQQDQTTYRVSASYTDARFAALTKLLLATTQFSTQLVTPELNDGGNYFGGKDWPVTIFTVPGGSTLFVHRWTFNNRATGDIGGAADNVQVTWTGFMGFLNMENADAVSTFRASGAYSATPIITIKGPATITANVFVNNLKCIETFGIEGNLVPDAYAGLS